MFVEGGCEFAHQRPIRQRHRNIQRPEDPLCSRIHDPSDIHTLCRFISTSLRYSHGLWGEVNARHLQLCHRLDLHMKPILKVGEGIYRVAREL